MSKCLGMQRIQVSDWMDVSDLSNFDVFTETPGVFIEIAGVFTASLS